MAFPDGGAAVEAGGAHSVQELVQRAEHALTTLQPELAVKCVHSTPACLRCRL